MMFVAEHSHHGFLFLAVPPSLRERLRFSLIVWRPKKRLQADKHFIFRLLKESFAITVRSGGLDRSLGDENPPAFCWLC